MLIVLLLGLVTDYSVFYLSAMRRRLLRGDDRLPAARAAVSETAPLVFAAGLIVTAGTAALLVGKLDFFRAFGPGLAATTLISLLVAGTLVPALMSIFGGRVFGRRLRAELAEGPAEAPVEDPEAFEGVRRDLKLERPARTAIRAVRSAAGAACWLGLCSPSAARRSSGAQSRRRPGALSSLASRPPDPSPSRSDW